MDNTVDELWMILKEHCDTMYRCCQNSDSRDAKAIYERIGRMQEIAKEILSKN